MFTLFNKLLLYALAFKFVLSKLKTAIHRSQPKEITYTDYKQFDSLKIKNELENLLTKENIDSWIKFDEQFVKL